MGKKKNRTLQQTDPLQTVTFGYAPRQSDGSDHTPVEWLVLDDSDGLLLITKEVITSAVYHRDATAFSPVLWEHTRLRKTLNGEFLSRTVTERSRLLPVGIGPTPQDDVTILSERELMQYLPSPSLRACTVTPYAAALADTDDIWWLRMEQAGTFVWTVETDGTVQTDFGYPCDRCGVRPVIRIKK